MEEKAWFGFVRAILLPALLLIQAASPGTESPSALTSLLKNERKKMEGWEREGIRWSQSCMLDKRVLYIG